MDWDHLNTWLGNLFSAGAIVGTLLGWLPVLAALIGAVWYCVQIYESKTFQSWLTVRRTKRVEMLEARLARMRQKLPVVDPGD